MKKDVLDFLRDELGLEPDEVGPLYESFMDSFVEIANELRSMSRDDVPGLRRVTHSIIGFSQNVGAIDLYEAAKELNAAAKSDDLDARDAGMAKIAALYDAYARDGQ